MTATRRPCAPLPARRPRAPIALAAVLALLACALLPSSAPARAARRRASACAAGQRSAGRRRGSSPKPCASRRTRNRKTSGHKRSGRRRNAPAPAPAATTRLVPAECEDGGSPVAAAGSYSCADGSQPACEGGSAPTAEGAGGAPMCVVPIEAEAGSCGQEAAASQECPLVEWACQDEREGSEAPQPCEASSGEQPAGEDLD